MLQRIISFEDREIFAVVALRRLRDRIDSEVHKTAIVTVLRNRKLRRAFVAEAWGMYQADVGEDGRLLVFFEWLLENSDEIIALIMKLLPLFV